MPWIAAKTPLPGTASGQPEHCQADLRAVSEDCYMLSGRLTFTSVPSVWQKGLKEFPAVPSLILDLAEVTYTDSTGLALILAWLREARRRKMQLTLRNVPQQMLAIARTTRLQQLFHALGGQEDSHAS